MAGVAGTVTTFYSLPNHPGSSKFFCRGLAIGPDNQYYFMLAKESEPNKMNSARCNVYHVSTRGLTPWLPATTLEDKQFVFGLKFGPAREMVTVIGHDEWGSGHDLLVLQQNGSSESMLQGRRMQGAVKLALNILSEFCFTDRYDVIISSDPCCSDRRQILRIDASGAAMTVLHTLEEDEEVASIAYDAHLGRTVFTCCLSHAVYALDSDGHVTIIAGSVHEAGGQQASCSATAARFQHPHVAVDGGGKYVIADYTGHVVYLLTCSTGVLSVLAGNGEQGYSDGEGSAASFNQPVVPQVDRQGNVVLYDSGNQCVRVIEAHLTPPSYAVRLSSGPQASPHPCMADVLFDERRADVRFRVGSDVIPAHILVLCSRSDYFRAMFEADMTETQLGVVTVEGHSPTVFRALLSFLYTGEARVDLELLPAVMAVAGQYLATELYNLALAMAQRCLGTHNALRWLLEAHAGLEQLKDFKRVVLRYVTQQYDEVVEACPEGAQLLAGQPELLLEVVEGIKAARALLSEQQRPQGVKRGREQLEDEGSGDSEERSPQLGELMH